MLDLKKRSITSKLRGPLLYALISFLFLAWPLLSPKILLPGDLLYSQIPLLNVKGEKPPQNAVLADVIDQFYPYYSLVLFSLKPEPKPIEILSGEPAQRHSALLKRFVPASESKSSRNTLISVGPALLKLT